jgi:hypothetical protein
VKYNIGSDMAARINFDEMIRQDIDDAKAAGWGDFDGWWEIASEQYEVDDAEEAVARAREIWG